jgi:hypothetical protein
MLVYKIHKCNFYVNGQLNEITQVQEDKHHVISLFIGSREVDLMKVESRIVITRFERVGE